MRFKEEEDGLRLQRGHSAVVRSTHFGQRADLTLPTGSRLLDFSVPQFPSLGIVMVTTSQICWES